MRLLCAAAISLVLGLFVAVADDKKPADNDAQARADKLSALKKKFDAEMSDLTKRLTKAEDPAEQRGIQAEMRELVAITAEKALAIASGDPKDETGFAAAEFVVQSASKAGGGGKDVEAAVALIAEHHAASPKVKELLIPAMRLGEAGEKLLRAVGEKATDKEAKATACFLRGYRSRSRSTMRTTRRDSTSSSPRQRVCSKGREGGAGDQARPLHHRRDGQEGTRKPEAPWRSCRSASRRRTWSRSRSKGRRSSCRIIRARSCCWTSGRRGARRAGR